MVDANRQGCGGFGGCGGESIWIWFFIIIIIFCCFGSFGGGFGKC